MERGAICKDYAGQWKLRVVACISMVPMYTLLGLTNQHSPVTYFINVQHKSNFGFLYYFFSFFFLDRVNALSLPANFVFGIKADCLAATIAIGTNIRQKHVFRSPTARNFRHAPKGCQLSFASIVFD